MIVSMLLAATAQAASRVYKPGDMVDGDGYLYKILSCNGTGEWDECEVQAYFEGKPTGTPGPMTIRNLRAAEQRVADAKKRAGGTRSAGTDTNGSNPEVKNPSRPSSTAAPAAPKTPKPAVRTGTPKVVTSPPAGANGKWKVGDRLEVNDRGFWYPAQILAVQSGKYKVHYDGYPSSDDAWVNPSLMRPIGGVEVSAGCSFDPPGHAVTAQSRFSEALAKRKIFDEYGQKVNGTLSAPSRVGVVFLSFEIGAPYKNTVANVPGYGAQRRHAGAAAGATIYPFKSKRMICEQYRDGVTRRLVEGTSACFVREGSWTCPSENDTTITQLDE